MFDARIIKLVFGVGGLLVCLLVVPLLFLRSPGDVTSQSDSKRMVVADYIEQARLASGIAASSQYKAAVSEYLFSQGIMPVSNEDLGMPRYEPYEDDALRTITVESEGVLRLSMLLKDESLEDVRLIPTYHESSGTVRWKCQSYLPLMQKVLSDCQILDR
jgi:hypothetical protein